jgi:hypothetical protein
MNVFVSGCAVASPFGVGLRALEDGVFGGRSGVTFLPGIAEDFPVRAVALLGGGLPTAQDHGPVVESLFRELGGGIGGVDGVVFSLSLPTELELRRHGQGGARFRGTEAQSAWLRELLLRHAGHAPPPEEFVPIAEACITGISALGTAAQRVRAGRWRRALALVSDLRVDELELLRFHALGALSTRKVPAAEASCPFSKDRDGFVKAQGAGAFVLESDGVKPFARVLGCFQTGDAYRITEGRADGSGPFHAMRGALVAAGLSPDEIDCVSAHGTSTPLNDQLETLAIKELFGARPPVTALKSQIGHASPAAGVLQVAASLLMLRRQEIPATINLRNPDPLCDLDYVPGGPRRARLGTILCNAFGFGGLNASLILGKP